MKIVVTGALGHIGSYVIRDLAVQFPGVEIVMIDNMMTQRFPSLFNLPDTGNFQFIEGDVRTLNLNSIFNDADSVIHLAAITDATGSFDKAVEIEENNYISTLKVATACLETNSKLITLSSTSVYGTQNEIVDEECGEDELQPQSPYAVTKLKEERLVKKLVKKKGLKAGIYRFGTIFGDSPGMRFHTAVNKFCLNTILNENVPVWKTALNQYRPYLSLSDAFKTFKFILENDFFKNDIFNVLSENKTVKEILSIIKKLGYQPKIHLTNSRIMNQLSYKVQKNKIEKHGLKLNAKIKKDIHETLKIFKEIKNVRF